MIAEVLLILVQRVDMLGGINNNWRYFADDIIKCILLKEMSVCEIFTYG